MRNSSRFWAKVDKSDECWEWTGIRGQNGYGHFRVGKEMVGAHRFAWTLENGPIPEGMSVLHRCDNPPVYVLAICSWVHNLTIYRTAFRKVDFEHTIPTRLRVFVGTLLP